MAYGGPYIPQEESLSQLNSQTGSLLQSRSAAPVISAGPTNFWQRIAMTGIKDVGNFGNAAGRFLFGNTAKFVNQGVQEGKQAVETGRMETAALTHNPSAFRAASQRSQKDYSGFKSSGGLLGVGTLTNASEAKQGALTTGLKKIGGGTLEAASEIVPMAKIGEGAKVYKLGKGLVQRSESVMQSISKNALLGAGAGATGTAGAQLLENGKISLPGIAKGAAASAAIGAGFGALSEIFRGGPAKALDRIRGGVQKATGKEPPIVNEMTDVMSPKQADKAAAAQYTKINVSGEGQTEKVGVRTPLRPGIKDVSTTNKITVRAPVKMSESEYARRFTKISKSYDTSYKALADKPPATQKILGQAIDNQHQKALEQLNQDYIKGIMPEKTGIKQVESTTTKASANTGGAPKEGVNVAKKPGVFSQSTSQPESELTRGTVAGKPQTTSSLKPVTGGTKTATSKFAAKVNARAIEAKLGEDLGTQEHAVMDTKDQANKAADLINNDPQKAEDIATGKKSAPAGLHPHAIFIAVEDKAHQEGNTELIRQLAHSKVSTQLPTAAGQTLRILRERDSTSPVAAIQHIESERGKTFTARTGKTIDRAVSDEVRKIKITPPSKDEWSMFVESIRC